MFPPAENNVLGIAFVGNDEAAAATFRHCRNEAKRWLVDDLTVRDALRSDGSDARYLFEDRDTEFAAAAEDSIKWLANAGELVLPSGQTWRSALTSGETDIWDSSVDALLEYREGVFESFFLVRLVRDALFGDSQVDKVVVIGAPEGLARALVALSEERVEIRRVKTSASVKSQAPSGISGSLGYLNRQIQRFGLWWIVDRVCPNRLRSPSVLAISMGGDLATGDDDIPNLDSNIRETVAVARRFGSVGVISVNAPLSPSGGRANLRDLLRYRRQGRYQPLAAYQRPWDAIVARVVSRRIRRNIEAFDAGFKDLPVEWLAFRGSIRTLVPVIATASVLETCALRRLLQSVDPSAIVSSDAFSSFGRHLTRIAAKQELRLICLQAGIVTPVRVTNGGFVRTLHSNTKLPFELWVWSEYYRTLLEQTYGIPPEMLRVVGFNRPTVTSSPGADIVYLSSGNTHVCRFLMSEEEDLYTAAAISSAALKAGRSVTVRIHPRQSIDQFSTKLAGFSNVRVVHGSRESISQSFAASGMVFAKASTALLEAELAGISALTIDLAGTPDFSGFGPTRRVWSTDGLEKSMAAEPTLQTTGIVPFSNGDYEANLRRALNRCVGATTASIFV